MALRNLFQRDNDIDLTDSHIELQRFDLRPLEKRAYVVWLVWQSIDVATDGAEPLHEIRQWWDKPDLVALHQLLKASSKKGLLELIYQIGQRAKDMDKDVDGSFSVTFGGIDATDTNPIA